MLIICHYRKFLQFSLAAGFFSAFARCLGHRYAKDAKSVRPLDLGAGLLYVTAMNWDWDKLQEKRQRQNNPDGGNKTPPPGNTQHDFNSLKEPLKKLTAYKPSRMLWFGLALIVVIWLASGFYIVGPSEKGVVLRFGRYVATTDSGPHYHWPYPVETVYTPNVTEVRIIEVGFRSQSGGRRSPGASTDAVMLTGDENIVYLDFAVKYRIKDPVDFLFRSADPDRVVAGAAEAVMREVIGNTDIDPILTNGKDTIQFEARRMLQEILDRYEVGIAVDALELQDVHPPQEVSAAFKDVIDASEDQRRFVNTATAYKNEVLPKARGAAQQLINEALAYKESRILEAQGEAARFLALLKEYNQAPDITRQRMYLEAMEALLSSPGMEKIIVPGDAAARVLPLLQLPVDGTRERARQSTQPERQSQLGTQQTPGQTANQATGQLTGQAATPLTGQTTGQITVQAGPYQSATQSHAQATQTTRQQSSGRQQTTSQGGR